MDPSAVTLLTQAVNANGCANPQATVVADFTATGTITYFWAGQPVQAPATVRGRGSDQFRLDAALPQGTRSYAVSHGQGALKDESGNLNPIPYHNTVDIGVLSLPYLTIETQLADPLPTISDLGLVSSDSQTLHQVRVQRNYPAAFDPGELLAGLSVTDYFLDPQTNLVAKVVDTTHPVQTLTENYTHEIDLENYTAVSGVLVPFLVREKVGGQTIWELQLSSVSFNTGLTDGDFALQ